MKDKTPVAIWERWHYMKKKPISHSAICRQYWSTERGDWNEIAWLRDNIDRDHWVLKDTRIFFTTEKHMLTYVKQFPKRWLTMGKPTR